MPKSTRETSNTMAVPANPKIYHITHVKNLSSIIADGVLWSDRQRLDRAVDPTIVGIEGIKKRRLEELEVKCHPGTKVGEYVPFYLCPRSVMLYVIFRHNHPDITYAEGQGPVLHLQADLREVVAWANANDHAWAFSDRNAGAYVASFFNDIGRIGDLNWDAIQSNNFRDQPIVKEGKQAEFLLYDSFPWELVEHIGVHNAGIEAQVRKALNGVARPTVRVEPTWYY